MENSLQEMHRVTQSSRLKLMFTWFGIKNVKRIYMLSRISVIPSGECVHFSYPCIAYDENIQQIKHKKKTGPLASKFKCCFHLSSVQIASLIISIDNGNHVSFHFMRGFECKRALYRQH